MPEGDTLFRAAASLGPYLEGKPVLALEFPRMGKRAGQLVGHKVTRVEARGKNLLIFFDEGSALHTHLRMSGVWHLYREGELWRRPANTATVVLAVPGFIAACFRAPVVRLVRAKGLPMDGLIGALGPDLLGETFDEDEALRRLRARDDLPLGVAVMDQRAVAGIGNVYKSEVLFHEQFDPFAPVRLYSDEELRKMLAFARRIMQANVTPRRPAVPGGEGHAAHYQYTRTTRTGRGEKSVGPLAVYGRVREACFDCGATIRMERQGEARRSTYYCPRCQPRREAPLRAETEGAEVRG